MSPPRVLAVLLIATACSGGSDDPCGDGLHDGGDGRCLGEDECSNGYLLQDDGVCTADPDGTFVHVIRPFGARVGARVVFHTPDGGVASEGTTGRLGLVSDTIGDGWVTVWFAAERTFVTRWVPGGSHTTFVAPEPDELGGVTGHLDLVFPDYPGAAEHFMDVGFTAARANLVGRRIPLLSDDNSHGNDTTVIATALDSATLPLAWCSGVAPTTGESTTTLSAWRTDFQTSEVMVTQPAGIGGTIELSSHVLVGHREYESIDRVFVESGDLVATVRTPALGAASALRVRYYEGAGLRMFTEVTPTLEGTRSLDLAARLLPPVDGGRTIGPNGRWGAEWRSSAPLTADVVAVTLVFDENAVIWRVEAPVDHAVLERPALPGSLAQLSPPGGPASTRIEVLDDSRLDGYRAWIDASETSWDLAAGGAGTVVTSSIEYP